MMNGLWMFQTALTMGKPAAMESLSLFRAVLTVGAVLVLAWWCSRLLGKQWVKTSGFGGNICLIEQIQVGQNQKILLLKVGEEYILVGVSPAGFSGGGTVAAVCWDRNFFWRIVERTCGVLAGEKGRKIMRKLLIRKMAGGKP